MAQFSRMLTALLLVCLLPLSAAADAAGGAQPEPAAGEPRYTFGCSAGEFDRRFRAIFDALDAEYEMGEEPNIGGAYEYHLPSGVYAKVLTYEGQVETIVLFLQSENGENQGFLWQYAAFMAAAAGDIPADAWAVLLLEASKLRLDPEAEGSQVYVAGNLGMICWSDPEKGLLYAILEREEYGRTEPMNGNPWSGRARPAETGG